MSTINTITVDIVQETIHDQIKKLAEALYKQSKVKLEDVKIDWYEYFGVTPYITNIKVKTTKRK